MLDRTDIAAIENLVTREVSKVISIFDQGTVVKRDLERKLIWCRECGDQPIPLYAMPYEMKYYDIDDGGVTRVKRAVAEPQVPEIGDTVLIVKMFGSRRLPKCIGVLQSKGFLSPGGD